MAKFVNRITGVIRLLFVAIVFCLGIVSLFRYTSFDFNTYHENVVICSRNTFAAFISLFAMSIMLMIFIALFEYKLSLKQQVMISKFVVIISVLAAFVFGMIWITTNLYDPGGDQKEVWRLANWLADGSIIPEDRIDYCRRCPNQAGMVLILERFVRVVGHTSIRPLKMINVLFMTFGVWGAGELGYLISKRESVRALSAVMVCLFAPFLFYTAFIYGTVISLALVIWSFVGTVKLCQTKKIKWFILIVVSISLANIVYSGSYIASIAIVIYLIWNGISNKEASIVRLLFASLGIVICLIFSSKLVVYSFYSELGVPVSEGIPATAYVHMGITSTDGSCGPGSFDSSQVEIYENNNYDSSAANDAAIILIKNDISEYLSGERKLFFFFTKTVNQWLDPFFSSATMTCTLYDDEALISDSFKGFLTGSAMKNIQGLLLIIMTFVYFMSGLRVAIDFKKSLDAEDLAVIFFIGGFVFQLFWESKGRYCLPYFVCIIPLAVSGIYLLAQNVMNRRGKVKLCRLFHLSF